tara:strand:- start:378 stop:578 length:201 start_codon:yes stop_codon:yes gene_type:complete
MGIWGIKVNKNMMVGNKARKNLNAMEEAFVAIKPFLIPSMKYFATSNSGKPSKPGKTILLEIAAIF